MSDKVILKEDKELVGLSDIVISELENKIYVYNTAKVEKSTEGSLAVYSKDNSSMLMGSGADLVWNKEERKLEVFRVESESSFSKIVESNSVVTTDVKSDYAEINKLQIKKWLTLASANNSDLDSFRISVSIDPITNKEALIIKSNSLVMGLEDDKIFLNQTVNIRSKVIDSPIGNSGDLKGDLAVDENFFYYCFQNYDGENKIWKRIAFDDWEK